MKIVNFKLSKNFKLLSLVLFSLINFNFSELRSMHLFGSSGGSAGAGAETRAGTSDTGSSGSRAAVGSALSGLFTKSHSDGDLSTLLARTVAKVSSIETGQQQLTSTVTSFNRERLADQQATGAALTRLDARVTAADDRLEVAERATAELRAQIGALDRSLITEAHYRELETKETVRDGLKITVPTIVDGASKDLYVRLSPDSKRAYGLKLHSLETNHESALARARGPQQDNTHAGDKKFMEDTVIGEMVADVGEGAARVAEKLTPAKMVAAAAATGLAVWLVRRHT